MRLYTVREEEYIVLIKYVVTLSILGGAVFDVNADKQSISSSARIKSLIHPEMKFIRSDFGFAIGQIFLFSANNKNEAYPKILFNNCRMYFQFFGSVKKNYLSFAF